MWRSRLCRAADGRDPPFVFFTDDERPVLLSPPQDDIPMAEKGQDEHTGSWSGRITRSQAQRQGPPTEPKNGKLADKRKARASRQPPSKPNGGKRPASKRRKQQRRRDRWKSDSDEDDDEDSSLDDDESTEGSSSVEEHSPNGSGSRLGESQEDSGEESEEESCAESSGSTELRSNQKASGSKSGQALTSPRHSVGSQDSGKRKRNEVVTGGPPQNKRKLNPNRLCMSPEDVRRQVYIGTELQEVKAYHYLFPSRLMYS